MVLRPGAAARRTFAALPVRWRRAFFSLLRAPASTAPATPLTGDVTALPAARPVLLALGNPAALPSPPGRDPAGRAEGLGWTWVPAPAHLDAQAGARHLLGLQAAAAGSPQPVGAVLGSTRAHWPSAQALGRGLGWPVGLLEEGSAQVFSAAELEEALARLFPRLSVIVVSYRHPALTRLCLASLVRWTAWPNLEVIVVDNASPDATAQVAREVAAQDRRVRVLTNPVNQGFPRAANQGVAAATGEVLCLANNDLVFTPGWEVPLLAELLTRPGVGLVGPSTNAAGNEARVETGYRSIEELYSAAHRWALQPRRIAVTQLGFFCVVLHRQVWQELGGLDEGYGLGYFEDAEFCWRARRRGWRLVCLRHSFVHHQQGAAFGVLPPRELEALWEANRHRYRRRRRRPA